MKHPREPTGHTYIHTCILRFQEEGEVNVVYSVSVRYVCSVTGEGRGGQLRVRLYDAL
jgi:hypothetical protein